MTWDPKLPKAPSRDETPWTSNPQIWGEWEPYVRSRGKPNTQRNLLTFTRPLFRMYENVLVSTLEQDDMRALVATVTPKCSRLVNGKPATCRRGLDMAACPINTGQPWATCPTYRGLQPSGVWSYICAINRMYDWMLEIGRVKRNPMLPVMREFSSKYKDWFKERARKPKRRVLELEEVRSLVVHSPLHHAIGYMLCAKCFLRIHEVLKLSFAPEYCNIEEGWMDIPVTGPDDPHKRDGNHRIILDAEAKRWMRRYREWWEEHVKRDEKGNPTNYRVLITVFGEPWGTGAGHNYNEALHLDAERLGIMTGLEEEREDRVNSHCFRAFATTWARGVKPKIEEMDLRLLRGDRATGAYERYDYYIDRLPGLYAQYAPVLGV